MEALAIEGIHFIEDVNLSVGLEDELMSLLNDPSCSDECTQLKQGQLLRLFENILLTNRPEVWDRSELTELTVVKALCFLSFASGYKVDQSYKVDEYYKVDQYIANENSIAELAKIKSVFGCSPSPDLDISLVPHWMVIAVFAHKRWYLHGTSHYLFLSNNMVTYIDPLILNEREKRQTYENVKSVITMTASVSSEDKRRLFQALLMFPLVFPNHECKFTQLMLYILIDRGLAIRLPELRSCKRGENWLHCNCDCSGLETLNKVYTEYSKNPLSLKQICCLTIRNCMKDLNVVADCYKLNIPMKMKHYLSFRSLNAEVRGCLLESVPNHQVYDTSYDVVEEVCDRYGVTPPRISPNPERHQ